MEANMQDEYGDDYVGPIIQGIPDGLMVGDFIVINGICQGEEVIVQLLTSAEGNESVVPLSIHMAVMGPVTVMNKSHARTERREYNVRNGLQLNMSFELLIFTQEAGYVIKLNKDTICRQTHLVPLESVGAILMDGDADFTSIEFKDIYGDDYEATPPPGVAAVVPPGMVKVQELRESKTRQKGEPTFVRSSTRGSKRARAQWKTSDNLARPDMDVDARINGVTAVNTQNVHAPVPDLYDDGSGKGYSLYPGKRDSFDVRNYNDAERGIVGGSESKHIGGGQHAGTYQPLDEDKQPPLYASSNNQLNSSKSSLFNRNKKSMGSDLELSTPSLKTDKKNKRWSKTGRTPSGSSPSLNSSSSLGYSSSSLDSLQGRHLDFAANKFPIRGPVPKNMASQPAPEIAAFMAGQKAILEFEGFHLTSTRESAVMDTVKIKTGGTMQHAAPPTDYSSTTTQQIPKYKDSFEGIPVRGPVPKSVINESAPEIASHVAGQKAVPQFELYSLTSVKPDPTSYQVPTTSHPAPARVTELSGPAPKMADTLMVTERSGYNQETTLTGIKQGLTLQTDGPHAGASTTKKLSGTAPEMAAILIESKRESMLDNITLTNVSLRSSVSKPNVAPIETVHVQIDKHVEAPPPQPSKVYDSDSDASTVHSDKEEYIRVNRDDSYYKERVRSLRNHPPNGSRPTSRNYDHEDSISSSVSSLDSNLLKGGNEGTIYKQSNSRQKVYATPIMVTEPHWKRLLIDAQELHVNKFAAELPVSLTPGRCAFIKGHFLTDCSEDQPCSIMLSSDVAASNDQLQFCRWRNGSLSISQLHGGKIELFTEWKSDSEMSTTQDFTLALHSRGSYLALSSPENVTIRIPCTLDLTALKFLVLESSKIAHLDQLEVRSDLVLPVELTYPNDVQMNGTQSLVMKTKFTADDAGVLFDFKTRSGITFLLVLDLTGESIHLRTVDTPPHIEANLVVDEKISMTFVPEQINELNIERNCSDDTLKILANKKELFTHVSPVHTSIGNFDHVCISGHITLLNANLN